MADELLKGKHVFKKEKKYCELIETLRSESDRLSEN
jgi:hypothetical protein